MEKFTNRELGMLIKEVDTKIADMKEENIRSHSILDTNQKSTNGRVKKLEMWKQFLLGAWAVLSMATPIAWYFIIQSVNNLDTKIDERINNAIVEYDRNNFEQ